MSREDKIHEIIENQDLEQKWATWEKVKAKLAADGIDITQKAPSAATTAKKSLGRKGILAISLAVVLVLTGVLVPVLVTHEFVRYCTLNDYYTVETIQHICDYASQNSKSILCLTWDNGAEYILGQQFILKENDKIIGLYEEGANGDGFVTKYWVINKKYELDFLDNFKSICENKTSINDTVISYGSSSESIYAMFKHKGYTYHLQVNDAPNEEYILTMVQKLFDSAK